MHDFAENTVPSARNVYQVEPFSAHYERRIDQDERQ
jgi:hypothetical protein